MKSDGRLPPDTELHLMHARLLAGDRQERETKLLGVFGKQGTRPSRAIVVGTQVLEQSLDVDFDVMLTDPAPIDLVLQRAGRLWRHDRVRPSHFTTAELGVVQLGGDAELPDFKPHSYVYDESVLLRSWALLAARDSLQLPDDIEPLVQRVYSREDATLSEGQRSRLMTLDRALDAEIEQNERNAEGRLLAPPGGVDDPFSNFGNPLDESDDKVHAALRAVTRLGDPSASVVCLSRSADGVIRLRRSGTQIALGSKPNFSLCRDLLEHAVSISRQGLVQQLQKLPKPSGWQETAFLRNHCALVFDDSRAIVGNTTIIDDPILGIVFEKEATS
jgi:CRISPR-associated endonuclease/helicase Cas3